jgi:LPXTG-motif cell wall-anchored protein
MLETIGFMWLTYMAGAALLAGIGWLFTRKK